MDRSRGTALVKDLLRSLELRPEEGREGWTSRLLETLVRATGAGAAYLAEASAPGWIRQTLQKGSSIGQLDLIQSGHGSVSRVTESGFVTKKQLIISPPSKVAGGVGAALKRRHHESFLTIKLFRLKSWLSENFRNQLQSRLGTAWQKCHRNRRLIRPYRNLWRCSQKFKGFGQFAIRFLLRSLIQKPP